MDTISFNQFSQIDIRIGTVVKAEVPKWSHWVMKLTVNFGKEIGKRVIFAGIMKHYKVSEIEGKQFPFLVNIEPKKIGPEGDYSQGMMLAACGEDQEDKAMLFSLSKKVPNGTKVF